MAFVKEFYLHPKFGSWSLLKLCSTYTHSSIEASLNSSHNQLNQLHDLTLRAVTQFTTTSTKYLFPAERSLLKLRSKQTREKNKIFQHFFEVNFLAALEEVLKIFANVFPPTRGMACVYVPRGLVSQSYCRVNDLGGKIPAASSGKFVICAAGLRDDLHPRDLPNAVTKKFFKTFQSQVSVDITDNFRSLPSEDTCWVMGTGILTAER